MPSRIEDYALIGDCKTAALVGRDGSIDWLCWPRFDSSACFAALLGTTENGRWLVAPKHPTLAVRRHYRPGTLILETELQTESGRAVIIDFMSPADGANVVRIVMGRWGRVDFQTELVVRFNYGATVPWVDLLRHNRQLSTIKLVRPSGREDLGEMAVTAGSRKPVLLAPVHCAPKALSSPSTSNCPSLHHRERGSPMKNRKREICTSGSVRDEDGQPPHLLGRRKFLCLAAGAAALPSVSRIARAQDRPSKPVRIIVGFTAGSATDIT